MKGIPLKSYGTEVSRTSPRNLAAERNLPPRGNFFGLQHVESPFHQLKGEGALFLGEGIGFGKDG